MELDNMSALFRELTPEEEVDFRLWARENYSPGEPVSGIWHPAVRDECRAMNEEAGK